MQLQQNTCTPKWSSFTFSLLFGGARRKYDELFLLQGKKAGELSNMVTTGMGRWKAANETGFFPINPKNQDSSALMCWDLAPTPTCISCTDAHCYPVTATKHAKLLYTIKCYVLDFSTLTFNLSAQHTRAATRASPGSPWGERPPQEKLSPARNLLPLHSHLPTNPQGASHRQAPSVDRSAG